MSINIDNAVRFLEDIVGNELVIVASKGFLSSLAAAAAAFGSVLNVTTPIPLSHAIRNMSQVEKRMLRNIIESYMKEVNVTDFAAFVELVKSNSVLRERITAKVKNYVQPKMSLFNSLFNFSSEH